MSTPFLLAMESSAFTKHLLNQRPKRKYWEDLDLYEWEGFWYSPRYLGAAMAVQSHFEAREDDVILASSMKTGTTWLKAIIACIMREKHKGNAKLAEDTEEDEDVLAKTRPADIVQTLEVQMYTKNPIPDLSTMASPRVFHTHIPYSSLPDSIKNKGCKIVYAMRNPKDVLVSMWHFLNSTRSEERGPYPFEKAFEDFCNGVFPFGPFFDHVLQYWKESLNMPGKILVLKYEEMMRAPEEEMKRLALFLGRPFENDEEVTKVRSRCSLERLKNLDVNKNGIGAASGVKNSAFYRLGVVGDWKNYFTSEMSERLDLIMREKLAGSGLDLEM
ncbi:Sulfotransferase domain [Dillenia turbinata]|uniref:Sulfotransferase n=1 Tax=Dillenia turbinata TaxID=194707 RepID=A0AAN8Z0J9_9MAGN